MARSTQNHCERFLAGIIFLLVAGMLFAGTVSAQNAEDRGPLGLDRHSKEDQPKTVKEFLAKQQAEKAKKDHEELLNRGDELLRLTDQLEAAYERNKELTAVDRAKLDSVEKLAAKIRKSMGGDGDGDDELGADPAKEEKPPANVKEAVLDLKEITVRLVDELKKTSRFSISVVAIQSSNSVLKIVKFLRLRK
jgi:hypothetical protein